MDDYKSMTDAEFNKWKLDMALEMFGNSPTGYIEKSTLFCLPDGASLPPDYDKVLAFLSLEGYLEEDKRGYKITYKGRTILDEGGFLKKYRREIREHRVDRIGILVGIVTGVAGLVLSIIALVK